MAPIVIIAASASAILPTLHVFSLVVDDYACASANFDRNETGALVAQSICDSREMSRSSMPIAAWREAYREMGLKPSETFSSVEALFRRACKPDAAWMTGIQEIDLYNAISIQHLAPLGGYAISKLPPGPVTVRASEPHSDRFVPIGGRIKGSRSAERVIVYAVGQDVLCWALNHRDSASFGLEADTKQAIFLSEALDDVQAEASRMAMRQLAKIVQRHGSGCSSIYRHGPLGIVEELDV